MREATARASLGDAVACCTQITPRYTPNNTHANTTDSNTAKHHQPPSCDAFRENGKHKTCRAVDATMRRVYGVRAQVEQQRRVMMKEHFRIFHPLVFEPNVWPPTMRPPLAHRELYERVAQMSRKETGCASVGATIHHCKAKSIRNTTGRYSYIL